MEIRHTGGIERAGLRFRLGGTTYAKAKYSSNWLTKHVMDRCLQNKN